MRGLILALAVLWATDAAAQGPAGRFTINIGGGVQAAASAVTDRFDAFEEQLQEKGSVKVDYPAKTGTLIDAGFAVRIRRQLRAGVAVSYASSNGTASVEAQVPHPFLFNRHRAISGTSARLDRKELGVHAQFQYLVPLTSRLHVVLAAGPSYFDVEQELVESVHFEHAFPYDEATFRSALDRRAKGTAVGFNVGGDVVWRVAKHVGLGGTVRFARGTVDLGMPGRDVQVDAGGVHAAAGIRLHF